MKKTTIYNNLPQLIKAVLLNSYGWLVGSSPSLLMNGNNPKDYDIIVENREHYQDVIKFLSVSGMKTNINSFGGLKFTNEEIEIDIWCEELGHYLLNGRQVGYIYCLRGDKLLQVI